MNIQTDVALIWHDCPGQPEQLTAWPAEREKREGGGEGETEYIRA